MTTFAGAGYGYDLDGIGTIASFAYAKGTCLDPGGTWFYICTDSGQECHQVVIETAVVTRIASSFSFNYPYDCIVDSSQNIYIVDIARVIKITYASINNGVVVAGNNSKFKTKYPIKLILF